MSDLGESNFSLSKDQHSDTQRRECDFTGEFESLRRATVTVDGKQLISGSFDNPLKRLKIQRFEDSDSQTGTQTLKNYTYALRSQQKRGPSTPSKCKLQAIPLITSKKPISTSLIATTTNSKLAILTKHHVDIQPLPNLIRVEDSQSDIKSSPLKSPKMPKLARLNDDGSPNTSKLPKLIKIEDTQSFGICGYMHSTEKYDVETHAKVTIESPGQVCQIPENNNSFVNTIEILESSSDEVEEVIPQEKRVNELQIESSSRTLLLNEEGVTKQQEPEKEIPKLEIHYEEISSESDSTLEDELHDEFHDALGYETSAEQAAQIKVDVKNDSDDKNSKAQSNESDEVKDFDNEEKQQDEEGNSNGENNIKKTNEDGIDDIKVTQLKAKLYSKLTGKSEIDPYGLDEKIREIYKLLSATVEYGECNSCFVFGPRNCGKTAVLEAALRRVKMDLTKEKEFIQIRLNGIAQVNDKFAVRAIAEQLDSEISRIFGMNLRELEISGLLSRKSINVTFSNILKILDKEVRLGNGSTGKIKNPIVFIIDEVDVYANQSRQTLLYNLFDLVENSSTPICVLCFTTKFTVKEHLEKRVRSRFSQRSIQFQKFSKDKFTEVATKILSIDKPENQYEEDFNENVEGLITSNSNLNKLIAFNHLTTGNIKDFLNHCIYPVSQLSVSQPFFQDIHFKKYEQNVSKGSLRQIVNSLSDLEIFLFVSAARVIAKKDLNFINLNLTYEEYQLQIKKMNKEVTSSTGFEAVASTGYKQWSKISCKHPWETLQNVRLLTLPNANLSSNWDLDNNSFETKMWHVELTLDELRLVIDKEKTAKSWTRL